MSLCLSVEEICHYKKPRHSVLLSKKHVSLSLCRRNCTYMQKHPQKMPNILSRFFIILEKRNAEFQEKIELILKKHMFFCNKAYLYGSKSIPFSVKNVPFFEQKQIKNCMLSSLMVGSCKLRIAHFPLRSPQPINLED